MPKTTKHHESVITILGPETNLSGRLSFKETLKIEGRFKGSIESTGSLYIGQDADVEADCIKAASVVVQGRVRGDIDAADRVELLDKAILKGNVKTTKLRIEDGVIFEGRCEMLRSPGSFDPMAE